MGGYGSGQRTSKKTTVEECRSIDAAKLARQGVFAHRGYSGRTLTWSNAFGEKTLVIEYGIGFTASDDLFLHLLTKKRPDGNEIEIDEAIPLVNTRPNFGGVRWWFICPLIIKEMKCECRARKLYLPPGARHFGCRTCYDLTYESAQTHDERINCLMKNPFALVQALESPDPAECLRACQAYGKVMGFLK